MFAFIVTGIGLAGVYIYISHALSTPKTTFNKCTYELYSMPI